MRGKNDLGRADTTAVYRICPGMHFADSSVYIWCAMILAVYDISKAVENGQPIDPIDAYTTGAVRYVPYQC